MEPGSKLLIPADPIADKLLPSHVDLIRFGEQADLQVTSLVESKDSLTFTVNFMDGDIFLPVTGKYNATNAMVASYVGKTLGVPDEAIKSALASLNLTRNRTGVEEGSKRSRYSQRCLQRQPNGHAIDFGNFH